MCDTTAHDLPPLGCAWPPVRGDDPGSSAVGLATPPRDATTAFTFAFNALGAAPGSVELTVTGLNRDGIGLSESNPFDNSIGATVRIAG